MTTTNVLANAVLWIGTVITTLTNNLPGVNRCTVRIDGVHGQHVLDCDLPLVTVAGSTVGASNGIGDRGELCPGARCYGMSLDGDYVSNILMGTLDQVHRPNEIVANASDVLQVTATNTSEIQTVETTAVTEVAAPAVGTDNAKLAWEFFKSPMRNKNYTSEIVAGILGNLQVESPGLDPTARQATSLAELRDEVERTGPARGIAMWEPPRYRDLQTFAGTRDANELMVQLEFIDHELDDNFYARDLFGEAGETVIFATVEFMRNYELPPADGTGSISLHDNANAADYVRNSYDEAYFVLNAEEERITNAKGFYRRFTEANALGVRR